MSKYYSTKTYDNSEGLSCVFRQWRSTHSHCSTLHGYAIGVKVIFEADSLDERHWVQDFGGLKPFKKWLHYMFDHTTVIAKDDPYLEQLKELSNVCLQPTGSKCSSIMDIRVVDAVGCEMFAELAYNKLASILDDAVHDGTSLNVNVRVKSVEVFEHGANSAVYEG